MTNPNREEKDGPWELWTYGDGTQQWFQQDDTPYYVERQSADAMMWRVVSRSAGRDAKSEPQTEPMPLAAAKAAYLILTDGGKAGAGGRST